MRERRRQEGFTLIEMVVALAIVAIMAGTIAPMAYHELKRARKEATEREMDLLAEGLVAFYEDTGRFPTEGQGLGALVADPGVDGWQGPYVGGERGAPLAEVLNDAFGRAYVYDLDPTTSPADAAAALIVSRGADGGMDAGGLGTTWDLDADVDDVLGIVAVGPVNRDKMRECVAELEVLAAASRLFYEDRAAFPTSPAQLSPDYMDAGVDNDGFTDPWRRDYVLVSSSIGGLPPTLTVRSWGPDRTNDSGGDDDVDLDVSSLPPGRHSTLWKLSIVQTALNSQPSLALTGAWGTDRAALGLDPAFATDGWGRAFAINVASRTVLSPGPDGNAALTGDNLPAGVGP